jgi:large subunit ribosomal protein L13
MEAPGGIYEMSTFMARKEDVKRKWFIVDAKDQILGRISTRIAATLRGKHKVTFTPHIDTGDFVIVINAEKVKLSGKKMEKKLYQSHSGQPGGFREEKFSSMIKRNPAKVIHLAVRGMLPKTKLGDAIIKKLKVYKGEKHLHGEVKPEAL